MSIYLKISIAVLFVIAVAIATVVALISGVGVPILVLLFAIYAWMVYIFIRYRHARQDELLNVMCASIDAKVPLAASLDAYIRDRPSTVTYRFSVAMLLHMAVLPYYWIWHRQNSFDRRVERLVENLDDGQPLSYALEQQPALASQETRLAVAVGEQSGRLPEFMRRCDRERTTAGWLEILPRLIYPMMLLMFVFGIVAFFMVAVAPRLKRIYEDFKLPLPTTTMMLFSGWTWMMDYVGFLILDVVTVILVVSALIASPTLRWYFPVIGRLYWWELNGLLLRALGTMIEFGRPASHAISLLSQQQTLPGPARRKLNDAHQLVESGERLETSLRKVGMVSRSAVPFLAAAERTHTLGWALQELGEQQSGRSIRVGRQLSMLAGPLLVIGVGVIVGVVVTGIFVPLVNLIEGLSR